MKNDPRKLLKGYFKVLSLPAIYTQINEAINSPRSSISDIGKIISKDSGLTARLLRLANSALYGFPKKIDTITRALSAIGTRELRDLVLATTIMSLFKGISEDLVTMESFWRHSIACGLVAKILATFRRDTNAERFFVAGLLHDIGRLLIYKNLADKAREALLRCKSNGELLYKVERELLSFDHADIGRVLLESWNIPANLEEVVGFHHHPGGAKRYPVETAVIHVADIIAHALQLGNSGERFVPPLDTEAWECIELTPSILSPTMDQIERQFNEVLSSILPEQGDG